MPQRAPVEGEYTPRRGQFKGQTFASIGAYNQAAREAKSASGDTMPRQRRPASGANGVTKPMLVGMLQFVNLGLSVIPAARQDVLEPTEVEALAIGALELARTNRYFANIVVKVCTMQAGSELAFAGTAVIARRVVPRLVQREIVPIGVGLAVEAVSVGVLNAIASGQALNVDLGETTPTPESNGVSETPVESTLVLG